MLKKLYYKIAKYFMSLEEQIDFQLQCSFKPKHKSKRVCQYCDHKIVKNDPQGYWVDGNGNCTYECMDCKDLIEEVKVNSKKQICYVYKWDKEPSISHCLNCNQNKECEQLVSTEMNKTDFKGNKENKK